VLGPRAYNGGTSGRFYNSVMLVAHDVQVAIRVLGRFEVTRDGIPVPDTEWQSRKARELLKILVARRGRACPRGRLVELLWPDEDDPAVLSNRLSVALATVRRILDPARTNQFLITEGGSVALHRVDVDVETFLRDATEGLRTRSGVLLRRATALYRGDVLEEDLYADWSHDLREEARAVCLAALRALAADTTDPDEAVLLLLRLLEQDRYDEPAHLALISVLLPAGRWGEADRAHRRYRSRMAEIGIEPAAVPGLPRRPRVRRPGGGSPLTLPPPVPAGLRRSPGTW
jgi:DNA-binding SARP family transcriptional activator